jgi:DNA replication factor GINS
VRQVNLDELQSVRDRERQTDKPQQLRESFYEDVGAFVEQLRTERDRAAERHDSPYADEVMQLTDEIDAAQQLVEDIHERRIGKVVKAASLEAADLTPEVNGLTTEEQDLFGQLVADIEHHREDVLAVVEGESQTGQSGEAESRTEQTRREGSTAGPAGEGATPSSEASAPEGSNVSAADVMGSSGDSTDGAAADTTGRQSNRRRNGSREEDSRSEHPDPEAMRPDTAPGDTADGAGDSGPRSDPASRDDAGGSDRRTDTGDSGRRTDPAGDSPPRQGPESNTDATASDGGRTDPADRNAPGETGRQTRDTATETTPPASGSGDTQPDTHSQAERRESTPTIGAGVERERVLVTRNVDTFVGSDDRDYDLAADDVVTLPTTNADILVERDAARRL